MTGPDLKKAYETAKAKPAWPADFESRMDRFVGILKTNGFEAGWEKNPSNGVDVSLAREGVSSKFHLQQAALIGPRGLGELFMDIVGHRKFAHREMLSFSDDRDKEHIFLLETEKEAKKMAEFLVKQLGRTASLQQQPAARP